MARKQVESTHEGDAFTDEGNDTLIVCGDRIEECIHFIQLTMSLNRFEAACNLRIACQIVSARILDEKADALKARLTELQS